MNPYAISCNTDSQGAIIIQIQKPDSPPAYQEAPPVVIRSPPPVSAPAVITIPSNVVVPQKTYRDYLALSILNIFFNLPFGIAAAVYSCKTQDSMRRGDVVSASKTSGTALILNMVALAFGIVIHVTWIVYVIFENIYRSSFFWFNSYYYHGYNNYDYYHSTTGNYNNNHDD
ncbi:uncharacterized protein O3C94_013854 [Discoglossus pictus]